MELIMARKRLARATASASNLSVIYFHLLRISLGLCACAHMACATRRYRVRYGLRE